MIPISRLMAKFPRAAAWVEPHLGVLRKVVSFGLIGVINAGVDARVFFFAHAWLASNGEALRWLDALAQWCTCATGDKLLLIPANVVAWAVAVSGSYLMNTFITFAAESGRRLRWLDYGRFAASGLLGLITNTAALYVASYAMPLLAAKGCAILAGFAVNFSMSHFVVFRAHRMALKGAPGMLGPTD